MRNHDFTVFCCLFIVKGSRFKVYGSRGGGAKSKGAADFRKRLHHIVISGAAVSKCTKEYIRQLTEEKHITIC